MGQDNTNHIGAAHAHWYNGVYSYSVYMYLYIPKLRDGLSHAQFYNYTPSMDC